MNQIIEELYLGDMADALNAPPEYWRICVLEQKPPNEPPNATWIPILETRNGEVKANPTQLNNAAFVIENLLSAKAKVLLHCGAGIERSPLACAWFLHTHRNYSIEEAYKLIIQKRPQVQDRTIWL
jgi:protein-tyrosine phosphatase